MRMLDIKTGGFRVAVVAGLLFFASTNSARAANHEGGHFRDFRQHHSGIDRHAGRKMFQSQRQDSRLQNQTSSSGGQSQSQGHLQSNARNLNRSERIGHLSNQSIQATAGERLVRLSNGVDLDMTSDARNIVLGRNLFSETDSIEIVVNGKAKQLSAGTTVSAAAYIAAKQVLSGAGQKISIDREGRAAGGEVDFGAITREGQLVAKLTLERSRRTTM